MPNKPIFLSGRLANLPQRIQERSASSEDGIECVLSDFDDDTGKQNYCVGLKRNLPVRYVHLTGQKPNKNAFLTNMFIITDLNFRKAKEQV